MINIGDLLRTYGHITKEQLDKAVAEQKKMPGKRLGQIIVAMKYATQAQITECLDKQEAFIRSTAKPKDATALADYAMQRAAEERDMDTTGLTGVFDVSEFRKGK